jgi:prepilin-type N-terminal cleavage/methylation domain-containing protein
LRWRDPDAEAGFTLLELLIALTLLAVTASLLVSAIGSARQALKVLDRRVAHASVPAVQSVLHRLLVEARPDPNATGHADPDRAFTGEPDRLGFVSSFVPQGQYGGLWRYEIALDGGEGAARSGGLLLTQQVVRPGSSATGAPLRTVMINGVDALRLRYFGAAGKDDAPQWQDSWPHPDRLPRLVAVDVTFARADGRQWTPLIVALPLAD